MRNLFKKFQRDQHGGAVVDWVVLTAGIVVLGLTSAYAVQGGTENAAGNVNTSMESVAPVN